MTQLVKQAVELFIETLPLESMDIDAQPAKFHHLYSQECKLFDCLRKMNEQEKIDYRIKIADCSHPVFKNYKNQ